MIRDGMATGDQAALQQTLRKSHAIRVNLDVLDRDEQHVGGLDGRIIEGSVDYDSTAAVTRSATVTILDPLRRLQWVPDSASEAAVYADNFLRVRYGVLTEAQGWVDVPVFWGPIVGVERAGPLAMVQAVGKESLTLAPALHWYPGELVKKMTHTQNAIDQILRSAGERRFAMPTLRSKIPRPLSLPWNSEPWVVAKGVARASNRQLFYDGLGRVRLRSYSFRPVYTFRSGPGGDVLEEPRLTFDTSEVRNTVRVEGPVKRKEKTHRVHAQAVATPSLSLSPAALSRHGKGRYIVDDYQAPKLRALYEARGIAARRLKTGINAEAQAELQVLPVPHLEEGDMVALQHDGLTYQFRVTGMSLPLVATSAMTINAVRRVRTRRSRG